MLEEDRRPLALHPHVEPKSPIDLLGEQRRAIASASSGK
jgi:hypothetical protein